MNNSRQLKMQLGQSHCIINITDSFFNGELKELFIDICKMAENIDKVSGPGLSYIASSALLAIYIQNPFYSRKISIGKRQYKSLFSFRTDICKSFIDYIIKNKLVSEYLIYTYISIEQVRRFEPIIYTVSRL
jgi:hypothetical protein